MRRLHFYIFILASVFFSSIALHSQENNERKIDSLEKLINSHTQNDTIKINAKNALAYNYYQNQSSKAMDIAIEALNSAISLNYKRGEAEAYRNIALIYSITDPKSALNYYFSSLKVYKELESEKEIAIVKLNISKLYNIQAHYEKAFYYCMRAIEIFEKLQDKRNLGNAYNILGPIMLKQGNSDKAIEYIQKSYNYYHELNNKRGMASALSNMGNIYFEQKKFSEALKVYQDYLAFIVETKDARSISAAYCNLGNAYEALEDYEKAMEYYNIALDYAQNNSYAYGIALNKANIGMLLHRKTPFKSLKQYSNNSDIKKAIVFLTESEKIADRIGALRVLIAVDSILYRIYQSTNDWKNAYFYYDRFKTLYSQVFTEAHSKNFNSIHDKFESSLKQKEIEILNREKSLKQTQLNFVIAVIILCFFLAIFFYLIYKRKRKENKALQEKNLIIAAKNDELSKQTALIAETTANLEAANSNLQKKENELIDANFNKDKFLSIIAQDFKNPISNIKFSMDKLTNIVKEKDLDKIIEMINSLNSNAIRAKLILDNIINWANLKMGNIVLYPFAHSCEVIINQTLEQVKELIAENKLNVKFNSEKDCLVISDEYLLSLGLKNLLISVINCSKISSDITINLKEYSGEIKKSIIEINFYGSDINCANFKKYIDIEQVTYEGAINQEINESLSIAISLESIHRIKGSIAFNQGFDGSNTIIAEIPNLANADN